MLYICVDFFCRSVSPPVEIFTGLATGAARLPSWLSLLDICRAPPVPNFHQIIQIFSSQKYGDIDNFFHKDMELLRYARKILELALLNVFLSKNIWRIRRQSALSESTTLLGFGRFWAGWLCRGCLLPSSDGWLDQGSGLVEARLVGWLDDVEVGAPPLVGPTQVSSSEPARPQTYASVTPKPRRRW